MSTGVLAQVVAEMGSYLAAINPSGTAFTDSDVVDALDAFHVFEQQVAAVKLDLIRVADVRDVPRSHGATSTAAWLAGRFRLDRPAAARLVHLAKFAYLYAPVAEGLRDGSVHVEQAHRIAKAVDALPSNPPVEAEQVKQLAAAALVEHAATFAPHDLVTLGAQVLASVAPEAAERAEREALERSERDAFDRRSFTLTPQALGGVKVTGYLTDESAASIRAAIEAVTAPRACHTTGSRPGRQAAATGRTACDSGAPHDRQGCDASTSPDLRPVFDERSPGQKRADALEEVCKLAARTEELPAHGGDRPQLNVTVPFDLLTGELGAGLLDTGEALPAEVVRRMACDAFIIPAVLGGVGQVLELGRIRRLITGPLRRALNIRDGGCAFPGCDRPPKWCEGHHVVPWSQGGPTDLANSTLLCGFHHRVVHQGEWLVRLAADGLPEFVPPPWVDRQQRPQRHHRFTLRSMRPAHRSRRHRPEPAHHLQT